MQPLEELPNYGVAGAVSSLLVVVALLLSWWYFKVLRFSSRYAVVTGRAYRPNLSSLGRKDGFCAWIFLGFFFSRGQTSAVSSPRLGGAAGLLSTAVLGGVEPGVAAQLLRLPWDLMFAARKHLAFDVGGADPDIDSLPGDIVGDSSIGPKVAESCSMRWPFFPMPCRASSWRSPRCLSRFFFARYSAALRHAIDLGFGLHLSRISFATRIINNSLAQIHPELEEAAFAGGLRVLQVMRKIAAVAQPALVYAWLWMALLCYRELTMASVLVTNQNNVTLPMIVWGLWLGGSLNQAAAANLVILVFMLPAVLLYLTVGRKSRLEEAL